MFFNHILYQFISFGLEFINLFIPKCIEFIHLLIMSLININLFLLMSTCQIHFLTFITILFQFFYFDSGWFCFNESTLFTALIHEISQNISNQYYIDIYIYSSSSPGFNGNSIYIPSCISVSLYLSFTKLLIHFIIVLFISYLVLYNILW